MDEALLYDEDVVEVEIPQENVMTSKDVTRSRKVAVKPLAYRFTGVDPATGKDRTEKIVYNRDTGAIGRNDIGLAK